MALKFQPPAPPMRDRTPRQAILDVLTDEPLTAIEISGLAGLSEKAVFEHMEHLLRSSAKGALSIQVKPAMCRKCGFTFVKRDRLTKPGRCPFCRERRIASARFFVS